MVTRRVSEEEAATDFALAYASGYQQKWQPLRVVFRHITFAELTVILPAVWALVPDLRRSKIRSARTANIDKSDA